MKKFVTGRVPLLIVIIAFLIFNCIFWPIVATNDISNTKTTLWLGYGFICGVFLICALTTLIKVHNKNVSISILPIFIVTSGYLAVSLLLNIIAMIVNSDEYLWALIINLILLLGYIAFFLVAYKHFARVNDNTAIRETRMKDWRLVAVSVSGIISFTDDPDIKKELNDLYTTIKCSSSASNANTKEVENELNDQITTIKSLIKNGADKKNILDAIKIAKALLKARNQMLAIR